MSTRSGLLATLGLGILLLAGDGSNPAVAPARAAERYASVLIERVPHIRQKPDFCGEACTAMWLRKMGHAVDQDYVFDQSGLDPLLGRGCYTRDLFRALQKIGFQTGPVWHTVAAARADAELEALWKQVHADLVRGVPAILCMHYDNRPRTTEHFRLILGYDAATDEVIYHEPAEARGAYRRMGRTLLLQLWPLKYAADEWTVIWFRLAPGRIKPAQAATNFTSADFAQHLMVLRPKVPEGFTIVLEPPFVVLGDEAPATVRRRAEGTVKWATDRLKAAYFSKDPKTVIDIWLFANETSYNYYCPVLFSYQPTTPFGFFLPSERALIMNIATGGGTLVHEIVHPFVETNFPACPAWLNEGLGSLYEQAAERDGQIVGLTNWRLAGLQAAIRQGAIPSFATLCGTTDYQFYNEDAGANYAQARYLCYYLQEKGLLRKFYHSFVANAEKDPTGYRTLQAVLGVDDMAAWQRQWERYVLGLSFP